MTGIATAQPWPDTGSLSVAPAQPTTSDNVMGRVEGTFDLSSQTLEQVLSKRTGSNILLDLLFDELPVGIPFAPPNPQPYAAAHDLGMLPLGTYQLTARTFTPLQFGGDFPDPWDFPEVFPPIEGAGPVDQMTINFTVIPEPTALALLVTATGVIGMFWPRRR